MTTLNHYCQFCAN